MNLLFRLFGIRLHLRQKLFFGGAFAGNFLAAKGVVFLMTWLTFGALGRACGFVIHDRSPVSRLSLGAFS